MHRYAVNFSSRVVFANVGAVGALRPCPQIDPQAVLLFPFLGWNNYAT